MASFCLGAGSEEGGSTFVGFVKLLDLGETATSVQVPGTAISSLRKSPTGMIGGMSGLQVNTLLGLLES